MRYPKRLLLMLTLSLAAPAAMSAEVAGSALWQDNLAAAKTTDAARDWIKPNGGRDLKLAGNTLDALLSSAPARDAALRGEGQVLSLPRPKGGFERFRVWEDSVMAPELARWMASQGYPMRTFAGESLDHPGVTLRADWGGPRGFHASVLGESGSYYIDPRFRDDVTEYVSYSRSDLPARSERFICSTNEQEALDAGAPQQSPVLDRASDLASGKTAERTGGARRVYRLAVGATGEYTTFQGGTVALGQAGIVTSINRVNQMFLRDASVFMILVPNNQDVVFTNSVTDGYTNNNGSTLLGQNQTKLDNVIGSANYDIGHVFSTGGGGVATLSGPCNNNNKARGVTGSPAPVGDAYDIDYVAHEMGHQYSALHSFNSATGNCGGGNRSSSRAYEPGSGITIMGYAGICTSDDLAPHSDAAFNYGAIDQILTFTAGSGNSCSVKVNGINASDPVVDAGPNFTIPANTPFELTALGGNDAETGGSLTYEWEQYDLGGVTKLSDGDTGSGPIIRSYLPTSSPVRSIPRLSTVLGQTAAAPGERLPSTNRTLTFRITVRDNDPDGGRTGTDTMVVTSVASAGPFAVTSPNGGETVGSNFNATWNVAGTSGGSVNTTAVDILFSADNGVSFVPLLLATPNDGSQAVSLPPGTNTSTARLKIIGTGNIFYDISNAAFTANSGGACVGGSVAISAAAAVKEGVNGTIQVTRSGGSCGAASVNLSSSNGTATAPGDFAAINTTLNWADGEAGSKSVNLLVVNDTVAEAKERFTATLGSPSGVTLGTPASTEVVIKDND